MVDAGRRCGSNPRPHQKTIHPDLSRLVGLSLLLRQDYFELIPSRSNNFQCVRGPFGALLEHFPDQTGFFIGLNVFEPVQDLPHDLQVLRALADGAPALKACD